MSNCLQYRTVDSAHAYSKIGRRWTNGANCLPVAKVTAALDHHNHHHHHSIRFTGCKRTALQEHV